jgi:hypothetical protein
MNRSVQAQQVICSDEGGDRQRERYEVQAFRWSRPKLNRWTVGGNDVVNWEKAKKHEKLA